MKIIYFIPDKIALDWNAVFETELCELIYL